MWEGTVIEENKGGFIALYKGIRVFIPASQSGLPKGAEMSALLRTKQKLRITEVNHSSAGVVARFARRLMNKKVSGRTDLERIEVGKKYQGTGKSLLSYGAFIDIAA